MFVDSKGQEPGQCRIERFVTVPLFLMSEWNDLNTGCNFIILDYNHLNVSSFMYLVICFKLLPGNLGSQLENLHVASLFVLFKWAGLAFLTLLQQVPSTSNARAQGRSALHFMA